MIRAVFARVKVMLQMTDTCAPSLLWLFLPDTSFFLAFSHKESRRKVRDDVQFGRLLLTSYSLLVWPQSPQSTLPKKENSANQSLALFSSVHVSFLTIKR